MTTDKPGWWNDTSNFVYSRLPDGALMGYSDRTTSGRDGLNVEQWMTLRRFERETAAPESHAPDGDVA